MGVRRSGCRRRRRAAGRRRRAAGRRDRARCRAGRYRRRVVEGRDLGRREEGEVLAVGAHPRRPGCRRPVARRRRAGARHDRGDDAVSPLPQPVRVLVVDDVARSRGAEHADDAAHRFRFGRRFAWHQPSPAPFVDRSAFFFEEDAGEVGRGGEDAHPGRPRRQRREGAAGVVAQRVAARARFGFAAARVEHQRPREVFREDAVGGAIGLVAVAARFGRRGDVAGSTSRRARESRRTGWPAAPRPRRRRRRSRSRSSRERPFAAAWKSPPPNSAPGRADRAAAFVDRGDQLPGAAVGRWEALVGAWWRGCVRGRHRRDRRSWSPAAGSGRRCSGASEPTCWTTVSGEVPEPIPAAPPGGALAAPKKPSRGGSALRLA